ncbi:MAG: hypothetical protein RJA81_563 [Planctomycetota bacterium]|jgi:hypothetical protein
MSCCTEFAKIENLNWRRTDTPTMLMALSGSDSDSSLTATGVLSLDRDPICCIGSWVLYLSY